jgi:hypothetical protein
MLVVLVATAVPALSRAMPGANPAAMVVGLTFGLMAMAMITFIQLGLCHLIRKWFFGATGKVSGTDAATVAWLVCELACADPGGRGLVDGSMDDGVRRSGRGLQAFCIAAGINVCIFALQF